MRLDTDFNTAAQLSPDGAVSHAVAGFVLGLIVGARTMIAWRAFSDARRMGNRQLQAVAVALKAWFGVAL